MSSRPISRSPDLRRLRDEGYDITIISGHVVVRSVPYVNSQREVKRGTLIMKLVAANDVAGPPDDHTARFAGEHPCQADGTPIEKIRHSSNRTDHGGGLFSDHMFSAKPKPAGNYPDYYAKVTAYVAILGAAVHALDPSCKATTFPLVKPGDDESTVFKYMDTASSRAEINAVTSKLEAIGKVAIVGLGGTGSYVLDLLAKTPVREIHVFDGDTFFQHNAFRCPSAASGEELEERLSKAAYFSRIYEKMRNGIVSHPYYIDESNVGDLRDMAFVFLCLDRGGAKKYIVEKLEEFGVPFIDVGMGVYLADTALGGVLRVTTSTMAERDEARARMPFSDGDGHNEYAQNIQIAELNALNAALAVIRWKKLCGFYVDLKTEFNATYTIDSNVIISDTSNET